jgi:hypothetical protein
MKRTALAGIAKPTAATSPDTFHGKSASAKHLLVVRLRSGQLWTVHHRTRFDIRAKPSDDASLFRRLL